jgi:Cytidylate kinase-like family
VGVWTIAAQEGTGGARLAAELAGAAEVSLLDRTALAALAHDLDPDCPEDEELDRRLGGRLNTLALSTAITAGSPDAFREFELRHKLPSLGRTVLAEVARTPCVIYSPAAFAALSQHSAAIHVRLWAPLDWRIAAYQREHLVDHRRAEKAVRRDDHAKRAWVKSLYHVDIEDLRLFSLVLDASRFSPDRLVQTLLAAGGVEAAPSAADLTASARRP